MTTVTKEQLEELLRLEVEMRDQYVEGSFSWHKHEDKANTFTELLALCTQEPAEWQVEAACREYARVRYGDKIVFPRDFSPEEIARSREDMRAALRAASIPPAAQQETVGVVITVAEALAQLAAAIEAEKQRNAVRDEMLATVIVNLENSEMTAEFAVLLRDYVRTERAKLSALEPASHKDGEFGIDAALRRGAEIGNLVVGSPSPVPVTDKAREAMEEALRFITDIDNSHRAARLLRAALSVNGEK